jgi:hypothetical protein
MEVLGGWNQADGGGRVDGIIRQMDGASLVNKTRLFNGHPADG